MNMFLIPWRNMRRRPSKTALLLLVFSLGVMSIVALYQVSRVVGENMEKKLVAFGANILISPISKSLSVNYGGFHIGDMLFDVQHLEESETLAAIHAIELSDRISIVAPKLITTATIDSTPVAVVGVDWQQELMVKSYWVFSGEYPNNEDRLLIGSRVAERLDIHEGDTLSLFDREFTVAGVLHQTGSDDDSAVFTDIHMLQTRISHPGALSFVEVAALCSGCPIEDIVTQLQKNMPNVDVKALRSIVSQRMASVLFVQKLAFSISVIILIIATAMIGLSMLSAVAERKRDIGLMRSLGYAKTSIFTIFCIEAGLIGAIAGASGYLFGFGTSFKVLDFLALSEGVAPHFSGAQLITATFTFAVITVLSAVYPAWKAATVEPATTLVSL